MHWDSALTRDKRSLLCCDCEMGFETVQLNLELSAKRIWVGQRPRRTLQEASRRGDTDPWGLASCLGMCTGLSGMLEAGPRSCLARLQALTVHSLSPQGILQLPGTGQRIPMHYSAPRVGRESRDASSRMDWMCKVSVRLFHSTHYSRWMARHNWRFLVPGFIIPLLLW